LYLAIGLVQQGTLLYVRSRLLIRLGPEPAGLFTAAWAIGWTYLSLLVGTLQPYYLTELANARSRQERSQVASNVVRLLSLVQTPISLIAVVLARPLMQTLYSDRFISAAGLLERQATADLLAVSSWAVFVPLVAGRHLGWAFLAESSFWVLFAGASNWTQSLSGLVTVLVMSRVAQAVVALAICVWRTDLVPQARGSLSMLSGFVLVVAVALRPHLGAVAVVVIGGAGLSWALTSVRKSEVQSVARRVTQALSRAPGARGERR
jgi:hypothetical protein